MNDDGKLNNPDLQIQDVPQPNMNTSIDAAEHEQPSQLKTLASENQDLQSKYQQALEKRTKQRDEYRARYQAAATKLNKYKLSDGGFPKLDDSYLIGRVESLRDKTWRFSLHYYEGETEATTRGQAPRANQLFVNHTEYNLRKNIDAQRALDSTNWRPMVIESFLWSFIVHRVFNRFWWAGKHGPAMGIVYARMKKNLVNPTAAELQSFQTWSATTTKLIRESQKRGQPGWAEDCDDRLDDLVHEIWISIDQHRLSEPGSLKKDIYSILQVAIDLDEEISQLLAHFTWEFGRPGEAFDERRMRLAESEQLHLTKAINIIICPGITKRGQSGNFDKVDWLVPIKVSCSTPLPAPLAEKDIPSEFVSKQ